MALPASPTQVHAVGQMMAPTHESPSPIGPPSADPGQPQGRRRRFALVVASVALLVQLLVPMTYYVGEASADERFAWRMFSSRRAETCTVDATETRMEAGERQTKRLRLSALIHRAWIHGLSRRRPAIVDRYFQWRCEAESVTGLRLVRHCKSATGEPLPDDTLEHLCPGRP